MASGEKALLGREFEMALGVAGGAAHIGTGRSASRRRQFEYCIVGSCSKDIDES